ncbi:hypothetical protein M501DRAFT_987673 [Patellaria atrata CBS 101060]|uniref:Uncharacterized protein n=1 Tax=Patellaria atrata CBS 101060 TaxID=1346257 RepID=A0A9P4VQ30_9PEZI|nr:hypothetical protein M501DRAFT_987673 [Patellaria atrata CBS 101060]
MATGSNSPSHSLGRRPRNIVRNNSLRGWVRKRIHRYSSIQSPSSNRSLSPIKLEPYVHPLHEQSSLRMRQTGDYLTVRAANPRTGLVTPSTTSLMSGRTPVSPGEALELYSPWYSGSLNVNIPASRRRGHDSRKAPHTRWRCDKRGWWKVDSTPPTSISTTSSHSNSSASDGEHNNFVSDRFAIETPCLDPERHESTRTRAHDQYKGETRCIRHKENPRPVIRNSSPHRPTPGAFSPDLLTDTFECIELDATSQAPPMCLRPVFPLPSSTSTSIKEISRKPVGSPPSPRRIVSSPAPIKTAKDGRKGDELSPIFAHGSSQLNHRSQLNSERITTWQKVTPSSFSAKRLFYTQAPTTGAPVVVASSSSNYDRTTSPCNNTPPSSPILPRSLSSRRLRLRGSRKSRKDAANVVIHPQTTLAGPRPVCTSTAVELGTGTEDLWEVVLLVLKLGVALCGIEGGVAVPIILRVVDSTVGLRRPVPVAKETASASVIPRARTAAMAIKEISYEGH